MNSMTYLARRAGPPLRFLHSVWGCPVLVAPAFGATGRENKHRSWLNNGHPALAPPQSRLAGRHENSPALRDAESAAADSEPRVAFRRIGRSTVILSEAKNLLPFG